MGENDKRKLSGSQLSFLVAAGAFALAMVGIAAAGGVRPSVEPEPNATTHAAALGSSSNSSGGTGPISSPASADTGQASNSNSATSPSSTEDAAALDPSTATAPDGTPIAESMPYKGMSAQLIDATWMGLHDLEGASVEGGAKQGSVPYRWRARNGSDDVVFTAYVRDGQVIAVNKDMAWANYWKLPDSILLRDFPDLTASGERVLSETAAAPTLPDPHEYDTPEEFADEAESYFAAKDSDDPWQTAYEYWEDNAA